MKLKYLLITILCLNNQTIKSNDQIIEYGKIAALSIGTALSYGLVHHGIAAQINPKSYAEESPLIQAIKSHGKMGGFIGMSLIWSAAWGGAPELTAKKLLLPIIVALTGVETASLWSGIYSYRKNSHRKKHDFFHINRNLFAIEAAHKMAGRAGTAALVGLDLYFAKKAFLT
jgi:hypothetical protein